MSARRATPARPVWLSDGEIAPIAAFLDTLDPDDQPYGDLFRVLVKIEHRHEQAPADPAGPHGAIRVAITNAYYDARNAGETMETAADNARDGVLVALGYPDDSPRQENPNA